MAGIYFHIPFCKQACHYCNFHFSTSLHYKEEMITAMAKEIELQSVYVEDEIIETIYFGGGTPSLLAIADIKILLEKVSSLFPVAEDAEITLETNPDDIDDTTLQEWKQAGINRLSIGVQSFLEEELRWMNRAHNAQEAKTCLQKAVQHFTNISLDLIYGSPLLSNEQWLQNVQTAIALGIPHLSCYALTVEPKTPLHKMIEKNKSVPVDADKQAAHFLLLMKWLEDEGYEHYEISNFARPGWRSRHNSAYWQGKKYLGIGPSAHSFNGVSRQWNVANNQQYLQAIGRNHLPYEKEILTPTQQLNEYIMTSLRTVEGLQLATLNQEQCKIILKKSEEYLRSGLMIATNVALLLTKEGKLFADRIAADLFL